MNIFVTAFIIFGILVMITRSWFQNLVLFLFRSLMILAAIALVLWLINGNWHHIAGSLCRTASHITQLVR